MFECAEFVREYWGVILLAVVLGSITIISLWPAPKDQEPHPEPPTQPPTHPSWPQVEPWVPDAHGESKSNTYHHGESPSREYPYPLDYRSIMDQEPWEQPMEVAHAKLDFLLEKVMEIHRGMFPLGYSSRDSYEEMKGNG